MPRPVTPPEREIAWEYVRKISWFFQVRWNWGLGMMSSLERERDFRKMVKRNEKGEVPSIPRADEERSCSGLVLS